MSPGIEIRRIWIIGKKKGAYLASVSMEWVCGVHVVQIRGMRLIQSQGRTILAMPNRQGRDGTWQDLVYPVDRTTREHIQGVAVREYERMYPGEGG